MQTNETEKVNPETGLEDFGVEAPEAPQLEQNPEGGQASEAPAPSSGAAAPAEPGTQPPSLDVSPRVQPAGSGEAAAPPSGAPAAPPLEQLAQRFQRLEGVDWDQLLENPGEVLPRFAAHITMQTLEAAAAALEKALPAMLDAMLAQREAQRSFEDRFFGRFPHLRGKEAQIRALVAQCRQMFPQATSEELVDKVGIMAEALFGSAPRQPAQRTPMPTGSGNSGGATGPQNPFADDSLWE